MTLNEFRIKHSHLIEHYQFIEAHLEGIYASLSGNFFEGLQEVDRDSILRILHKIQAVSREKGIEVLSPDQVSTLQEINKRRNFWCHSCYFELAFGKSGPKKAADVQHLIDDLKQAEMLRESLFARKTELMRSVPL